MIKQRNTELWNQIKSGKLGKLIAGPCAVESRIQLEQTAAFLKERGIQVLRAGAYKPRTSPESFQGLGREGVKIIQEICKQYSLFSVTEIMDIRELEYMEQKIDILQVGSRNMHNYSLLKELGKTKKTILLKRGLMSTLAEFICAADYIRNEGNNRVIMCERGIRTFESATRNTLDISCIALLKLQTDLPVVSDLSHSLGRKDIILPIAKASIAAGADMLMMEVHPNPSTALSDAQQQLSLEEFDIFYKEGNFGNTFEKREKGAHC